MIEPRHTGNAFSDFTLRVPCRAEPAQIALDIGSKYRHTCIAEGFGQTLQCHGFTGASSACDQAVTVRQPQKLPNRLPLQACAKQKLLRVRHVVCVPLGYDSLRQISTTATGLC